MLTRSRIVLTALVALGVLSTAIRVEATTYFVSKSGNDSNPCTQGSPCLTIGRGRALAQAGDIVQVGAGNYGETVSVTGSGTAVNRITFRGQDGSGCPTSINNDINSRGVRPAPTVSVDGFNVNGDFIDIECFRFVGSTGGAGVSISANRHDIRITNTYTDASGHPGSPWTSVGMPGGVGLSSFPSKIYFGYSYVYGTQMGILVKCRDCMFEFNEIERMQGGSGPVDHDYVQLFGTDLVFRGNYFHGNADADCPGDCHSDCFQSWNIGQLGEVAQRITIDRNTCFNSHQKIIVRDVMNGNNPSGSHTDWTITNNLFAYPSIGGPGNWCLDIEGVRNVVSYFNACVEAGASGYRFGTNASHANNIHYNSGTFNLIFAESGATMIARNNLCFDMDGSVNSCPGTSSINNRDPQFVNVAARDFHIKSTSPARDTGVAVGVNVDLAGNARPEGAGYDIGAHEFGASSTSRPDPPTNLQVIVQ